MLLARSTSRRGEDHGHGLEYALTSRKHGVKFNFVAGAAMVVWGFALSKWLREAMPGGASSMNGGRVSNAIVATASLEARGENARDRGVEGVGGGRSGMSRKQEGRGGVGRGTLTAGAGIGRRDAGGRRLGRFRHALQFRSAIHV